MSPFKHRFVALLVGLLFVVVAWIKMIHEADLQPFFIDEVSDTFAAFNFIEHGDYTSHFFDGGERFGPGLSVGFMSSWPGGLVWSLGGGLFESRLALGFVGWVEAMALGVTFFFWVSRLSLAWAFFASAFWFLMLLQTPYWHGFLLNVGELTGALAVGAGLLAFGRGKWWLSGLFLGLAVWSCKFIYVPIACVAVAAGTWRVFLHLQKPGSQGREAFSRWLGMVACFWVPLVAWLVVIACRYDGLQAELWLARFVDFVVRGNSGLDGIRVHGLNERLASPMLEWAGYDSATKLRILFLLSAGCLAGVWYFVRRRSVLVLGLLSALVFYSLWFFLWSPTMFLRHAQPALYLGFGLLAAVASIWVIENRNRRVLGIVALVIVLVTLKELRTMATRFPVVADETSYARACTQSLTRVPCIPARDEIWLREIEAKSANSIYSAPPFRPRKR